MKILIGQNCKHFIDFDVTGDYVEVGGDESVNELNKSTLSQKYTIKAVNISNIRINDIVDFCYEILEPKNNLNNPVIRQTFEVLDSRKKREIGKRMLIFRYCIHRILTLNKVYKPENWIFKTMNDYYGEEVDIICLKPIIADKVDTELLALSAKSDSKKIEFVLELEYGHLIPTVINKVWDIVQLDLSQLIFSNQKHFESCCEKSIKAKYLQNYKLPRGIVSKQGDTGKYKVIDGYHRICAVPENQKFLVIFCESSNFTAF